MEYRLKETLSKMWGVGSLCNYPSRTNSDLGFHGDQYLLNIISIPLEQSDVYIETGAHIGKTLSYVASRFPHLRSFSCEPDTSSYANAREVEDNHQNVTITNEPSQEFLPRILEVNMEYPTIFLDAHGHGFQWPLQFEVATITSRLDQAAILIDDFKVPGRPEFGYDRYDGQSCSMEYIESEMHPANEYQVIYPAYRVKTSPHHPLRGYGLILMNCSDVIPSQILENFTVIDFTPNVTDSSG